MMLLEDCPASRSVVKIGTGQFPVFPEFSHTSYAERYDLLCKKLVKEQLYTTATLMLSRRDAMQSGRYSEMSELTGVKTFVTTLAAHIAGVVARM